MKPLITQRRYLHPAGVALALPGVSKSAESSPAGACTSGVFRHGWVAVRLQAGVGVGVGVFFLGGLVGVCYCRACLRGCNLRKTVLDAHFLHGQSCLEHPLALI